MSEQKANPAMQSIRAKLKAEGGDIWAAYMMMDIDAAFAELSEKQAEEIERLRKYEAAIGKLCARTEDRGMMANVERDPYYLCMTFDAIKWAKLNAMRERDAALEEIKRLRPKVSEQQTDLQTAIAFLEMDEEADKPGTDLYTFLKVLKHGKEIAEDYGAGEQQSEASHDHA